MAKRITECFYAIEHSQWARELEANQYNIAVTRCRTIKRNRYLLVDLTLDYEGVIENITTARARRRAEQEDEWDGGDVWEDEELDEWDDDEVGITHPLLKQLYKNWHNGTSTGFIVNRREAGILEVILRVAVPADWQNGQLEQILLQQCAAITRWVSSRHENWHVLQEC